MNWRRRFRAAAMAAGLSMGLWGGVGAFAAPLTFEGALRLAETQAPSLSALSSEIEAAAHSAQTAGELPDPKLYFGVNNFPISGSDRDRFNAPGMTMQEIGIMQEFPNSKKREARVTAMNAATEKRRAVHQLGWIEIRQNVAAAWIECFYLNQKNVLFDALVVENRILGETVWAQIAAGTAAPVETVTVRAEEAVLADRRDQLNSDIAKVRGTLRRWIGDAADEPLSGGVSTWTADFSGWRRTLDAHPQLRVRVAERGEAQSQAREAEATKTPDWGVELAYQRQRAMADDGNVSMVMLRFSFDLPLFGERRQDPLIRARYADLARVDALAQNDRRLLMEMLEQETARHTQLTHALNRLTSTWLPLLDEKVALQEASYAAGNTSLSAVLDARREHIEMQLKKIDLEKETAQLIARLTLAFGDLP